MNTWWPAENIHRSLCLMIYRNENRLDKKILTSQKSYCWSSYCLTFPPKQEDFYLFTSQSLCLMKYFSPFFSCQRFFSLFFYLCLITSFTCTLYLHIGLLLGPPYVGFHSFKAVFFLPLLYICLYYSILIGLMTYKIFKFLNMESISWFMSVLYSFSCILWLLHYFSSIFLIFSSSFLVYRRHIIVSFITDLYILIFILLFF